MDDVPAVPPSSLPSRPGRGGVILALGIVSLLLLGPLTGIAAWVMGHRDLRRITAGEVSQDDRTLTQVGTVLGIVGTFLSPVFLIVSMTVLAVTLAVFNASSVRSDRNAMMDDARLIASTAYAYRLRPSGASGGGGSYDGFVLSSAMKRTEHGAYHLRIVSPDEVEIIATSLQGTRNGLICVVNEHGTITRWSFTGDFDLDPSPPRRIPAPNRDKSREQEQT